MMDREKAVFLLFDLRFEFTLEEIESIDFTDTEDEFEIILDDDSVLQGMIVEQDDLFFTIGSSAGLTTIDKERILEIKNPRFAEYYEAEKERKTAIHLGVEPAGSVVLNDFGTSYQPYGSLAVSVESDFGSPIFFGLDINVLVNFPRFGDFEDFLLVLPLHLYMKYQGMLAKKENLLWMVKIGAGCAPVIFMETGDSETSTGLAISQVADFGILYKTAGKMRIGGNIKANLVVQHGSFIFTQSAGMVLEFNL